MATRRKPRSMRAGLLVLAVLLAACTTQVLPAGSSVPVLAPVTAPAATGSASPCRSALSHVAAFASALGNNLADLRPLILVAPFESSRTASGNARVSATIRAYDDLGLAKRLETCAETAALAAEVLVVTNLADKALAASQASSVDDARVQQSAAVALFGLLPRVIGLSEAAATIATSLGLPAPVAVLPAGATTPLGSLPPLPRPTAIPTASPRATPRPAAQATPQLTAKPVVTTDWSARANAYIDRAFDVYTVVRSHALDLYGVEFPPGLSPEEAAAREEAAALSWKPAVRVLKDHLAYMSSHAAHGCYSDAYSADRALANRWLTLLPAGVYPGTNTSEAREAAHDWDDALGRTNNFLSNIGKLFADCR